MLLDAVEYKNGQKNNWRRTAWNAIREVTPNPKKTLVLYLPGETDLDRFVAQRKGFDPRNMIAVERNKKVVDKLRDQKRTVIHGDLLEVMANWPADVPVDVVIADLQSCFSTNIGALIYIWMNSATFVNCAMLLNIQRGRESASDRLFASEMALRKEMPRIDDTYEPCLNRASYAVSFAIKAVGFENGLLQKPVFHTKDQRLLDVTPFVSLAKKHFSWKIFDSYRSTDRSPLFDSVLLKNKGIGSTKELPIDSLDGGVKRKISAALAVRTMRLNGKLRSYA